MLTAKQVATRLNIGLSTVYRLTQTGDLPSVRLGLSGGAIRFRPEDVDELIRAGKRRAELEAEGVIPFRGRK